MMTTYWLDPLECGSDVADATECVSAVVTAVVAEVGLMCYCWIGRMSYCDVDDWWIVLCCSWLDGGERLRRA